MSTEPREVDPKDFQRITYRGVGLAAFTPYPKIKWRSSPGATSTAASAGSARNKAQTS